MPAGSRPTSVSSDAAHAWASVNLHSAASRNAGALQQSRGRSGMAADHRVVQSVPARPIQFLGGSPWGGSAGKRADPSFSPSRLLRLKPAMIFSSDRMFDSDAGRIGPDHFP